MKLLLLLLLFSLFIQNCSPSETEPNYEERTLYFKNAYPNTDTTLDTLITCVSYNIQCGFPSDMSPWTQSDVGATREHIKALAAHIRKLHPDIVCLQEVARNRSNTEVKLLLEALAEELQMNYVFGAHGYNDALGVIPVVGEWGNAILSRFSIENAENVEIERISVWERRSIVTAIVNNGGTRFAISSLHFIPTDSSAKRGAEYFARRNSPFHQLPRIIGGDCNMGEVPEFESLGVTDALRVAEPREDDTSIDKIFCSTGSFTVLKAGEHTTGLGDPADRLSDHRATYALLLLLK